MGYMGILSYYTQTHILSTYGGLLGCALKAQRLGSVWAFLVVTLHRRVLGFRVQGLGSGISDGFQGCTC